MAPVHPVLRVERTESFDGTCLHRRRVRSDHLYFISVTANPFSGCDYGDPVQQHGTGIGHICVPLSGNE
jgi:hypothetical protein